MEEQENTYAEFEAMANLKTFNMEQQLIRALYACIAKELFLKMEEKDMKKRPLISDDFMVSGSMAMSIHQEYNGQTLQEEELEDMYMDICP